MWSAEAQRKNIEARRDATKRAKDYWESKNGTALSLNGLKDGVNPCQRLALKIRWAGLEDEFIKIKVTAQPIENKANKALIEFLSKTFKIPKSNIEILKGDTSKEKTLLIKTNNIDKRTEIITRLTK
mgnify:CR=1 FL=1